MLGARIVDVETGGPHTTGRVIGGYFGYFLSMIPFCLDCIWVAFDACKQRWHDKLAGSVVVQSRSAGTTQWDSSPICATELADELLTGDQTTPHGHSPFGAAYTEKTVAR